WLILPVEPDEAGADNVQVLEVLGGYLDRPDAKAAVGWLQIGPEEEQHRQRQGWGRQHHLEKADDPAVQHAGSASPVGLSDEAAQVARRPGVKRRNNRAGWGDGRGFAPANGAKTGGRSAALGHHSRTDARVCHWSRRPQPAAPGQVFI